MPTVTTTTNYYNSAIALEGEQFRDEVLLFTGAGTVAKGTILGRITASGKLKPFATGSSDGSQIPVALVTYDVTATGAGDVAARALVRGVVNRNKLIIAADGNGNNITPAIIDQLRDYGITPIDVQDIALPT
jgi:hypothetical protein